MIDIPPYFKSDIDATAILFLNHRAGICWGSLWKQWGWLMVPFRKFNLMVFPSKISPFKGEHVRSLPMQFIWAERAMRTKSLHPQIEKRYENTLNKKNTSKNILILWPCCYQTNHLHSTASDLPHGKWTYDIGYDALNNWPSQLPVEKGSPSTRTVAGNHSLVQMKCGSSTVISGVFRPSPFKPWTPAAKKKKRYSRGDCWEFCVQALLGSLFHKTVPSSNSSIWFFFYHSLQIWCNPPLDSLKKIISLNKKREIKDGLERFPFWCVVFFLRFF